MKITGYFTSIQINLMRVLANLDYYERIRNFLAEKSEKKGAELIKSAMFELKFHPTGLFNAVS